MTGEQVGHPTQHLPTAGGLRAESGLPAQYRRLGAEQRHAATQQHPGALALLGEIPAQPPEEGRAPGPPQGVRPGEQIASAAFLDDLRSENPFGHEKWRIGQIKSSGGHLAILIYGIDGYVCLAVPDELRNDLDSVVRVPGSG